MGLKSERWRRLCAVVAATAVAFAPGCANGAADEANTASTATAETATTLNGAPATMSPEELLNPLPPPADHGLADDELADAVASSVRVTGRSCGLGRDGSGFAVHDGELVATTAHTLVGLEDLMVELADGRVLDAQAVAVDRVNDLALLRVPGAALSPLPLADAAPEGTVGAVLAWEDEQHPDPTPFRIHRRVTALTDPVEGGDEVERRSWLVAAEVEFGDSGAALAARVDGRISALGVVWSASRRRDAAVAYATRAEALKELLASADLEEPVELPGCL